MQAEIIEINQLQHDVERASHAVWMEARELNGYRRHNGARKLLANPRVLDDIEKARDYLSRILDDVRGVS